MKSVIRFSLFIFFVAPYSVLAQVIFTEIMYDPEGTDANSGGEWVEFFNSGTDDIKLSDFKIADRATSGSFTNRTVTHFSGLEIMVPGEYSIVAKDPDAFVLFFPFYSGGLFKSAFSLTDDDELEILDSKGVEVDQVSYTSSIGGKGDGNSIQKDGGVWVNGTPTPGTSFSGGTKGGVEEEEESTPTQPAPTSSHAGPTPITTSSPSKPLSVYIGKDRMTSVDNPLIFEAQTNNISELNSGVTFVWNMGDGLVRKGRRIEHSYKRPGTYAVVLNAYDRNKQATARVKVRVEDVNLEIEGLSGGDIGIKNNHKEEINLYDWELRAGKESFIFPMDTILLGGTFLALSPDISKLRNIDGISLELLNPENKIISRWQDSTYSPTPLSQSSSFEDQTIDDSVILYEIIPPNFARSLPPPPPRATNPAFSQNIDKEEELISVEKINESAGIFQVAAVSEAFKVEKPLSVWKRIGGFIKGLFD